MTDALDPSRCLALLSALRTRHGSQVFGQQMQRMLAHSFRRAGFIVTSNAIGVPDFVASRRQPLAGYAVEAKTGAHVSVTPRELASVRSSSHVAVIAVLLFPDFDPRWVFLDARAVGPGVHSTRRLRRNDAVALDFDANLQFRRVLADFHDAAFDSSRALENALGYERLA